MSTSLGNTLSEVATIAPNGWHAATPEPLPGGLRAARAIQWGSSGLVLLLASSSLLWHAGVARDLLPNQTVMQAPAAAISGLLAVSLACLGCEGGSRRRLLMGRAAAGLAAVGALLSLLSHVGATAVLGSVISPVLQATLGRLPAPACAAALALAMAMFGLRRAGRVAGQMAVVLALISGVTGLLAVFGHLFSAPDLYQVSGAAPVVPGGAITLLILSLGVWCAQPRRGPLGLLLSDDAGGASLRRLLPAVLLVMPTLALLRVASEQSGLLVAASSGAVFSAVVIVILGGLLVVDAAWLGRVDRRRMVTERRLAALAADLERQVAERTRELSHRNAELRREVAERKRAEVLFRGVFDGVPEAVLVVDQQGRIELANDRCGELFGHGRGDLIGQSIECLVPPAIAEQHAKRWQAFLASPRPYALFGEQGDVTVRRADGSETEAEITLGAAAVAGRHASVIVSVRDISARLIAQRDVIAANARYHSLVDNLPIGIFVSSGDPDGTLLEANPAMLRVLEADSMEALRARSVATFRATFGERVAMLAQAVRSGGLHAEEFECVTLRGRHFQAAITVAPRQVGNAVVWDGVLEDISARRQAEQSIRDLNVALAERASELEVINRELEAFSYSVSHDLRAPLRAIDGFSRILEQECGDRLDAANRQGLARVRHNAQHMATLIDDLLNLARVARAPLQWREVDLSALATQSLLDLAERDPDRAVTIHVAPDLRAWGDVRLLRLAMQNLLDNAWKFTGHTESARIEFEFDDASPEPGFVVRDNGAGFDMAYADKLFGAFQRLHGVGEFPGTGVGLATVQRIIHKHGGRIWAHARPMHGASFHFTLPQENPHG